MSAANNNFRLGLPTYLDQVASGKVQEVALSSRGVDTDLCRTIAGALARAPPTAAPRVVDLNDNGINDDGLEMIVDALRSNKAVLELHLMNNLITDRGAEFLLRMLQDGSNIRTLALGGNKVSDALVKEIEQTCVVNTQPVAFRRIAAFLRANDPRGDVLEIFDDNNTFSMSLFKAAVAKSEHLRVLRLAGCHLADGGCGSLAEIIPNRKGLEVLDLSRNGITSHGLRHLVDALARNTSLRVVILSGNRLTDEAARSLGEMLRYNNTIVQIEISENAIAEAAHAKLRHAVLLNSEPLQLKKAYYAALNNDPAMTSINLQWVEDSSRAASVLAPALKQCRTVTTLNLSNSRMGDAGLRALIPVLQSSTSALRILEVANCNITSTAVAELCRDVLESRNTTLAEINLANNKICNRGGKAIATALLQNWSLHLLNLELNELAPDLLDEIEGLLAINRQPRALKRIVPAVERSAPELSSIDLSQFDGQQYHNAETARILALALRGNTACTSLNLSGNPIGDDGAKFIAELIASNSCALTTIILEDCAINERGGCFLAKALGTNTRLLTLVLRNNSIGNETGEALLLWLGEPNDTLTTCDVTKTRIIPELRECIEAAAAINSQPPALKRILPQLENQSPVRHRVKGLPPAPRKIGADGRPDQQQESAALVAAANNGKAFKEISFRRDVARSLVDAAQSKPLTDVALQMLCTQLAADGDLESLDLAGNALTAASMPYLAAWLARPTTRLTHLSLAGNSKIGDEGVITLARKGFAVNQTLKEINLSGTNFTAKALEALTQALKVNDSIVAVDYDETPDMSKGLRTEFVRELALNTQNIDVKRLVERIIANDPALTVVDLADKHIGDLSVKLLSLALVHNTVVQALNLAGNDISSAGIDFLGDLLEDNTTIQSCSLAYNNIDDRGAQFLIRVLAVNNTIKELDVTENAAISAPLLEELGYMIRVNNGPLGFKRSMSALVSNSESLLTFDGCGKSEPAGGNKYNDDSMLVLCSLLVDNTVVTRLDLSYNHIGDEGATLLANTLRVNRTVTAIDLSHNNITAAGVDALFNALKSNTTLTDVRLEGNPVPKSVIEVLDGPLNVNRTTLRAPASLKGGYKGRPKVEELGDSMLRDIDYLNAVEAQTLEDGMRSCPKRRDEIFKAQSALKRLVEESQQRAEITSLTWNREKERRNQIRDEEYASSVSPLRKYLKEQKKALSTDPIDKSTADEEAEL